MSTNFAKEFKLYEGMYSKKPLKESRSVAKIEAEIEKLQQELQQARAAEKSAAYTEFPTELYAWDMYITDDEKGTWCSAEKDGVNWDGVVFETEEDAVNAALTLLNELDDENELSGDKDDYSIDTFTIPLSELTVEDLEYSDLEHLIPAIIK